MLAVVAAKNVTVNVSNTEGTISNSLFGLDLEVKYVILIKYHTS